MTNTHALSKLYRRSLVGLSALLLFMVCAYVAFVLTTIVATAGRADADRASRDATARIASLEQKLLSLDQELTRGKALSLGFVEPERSTLVAVSPEAVTLSFEAR